MDDLMLPEPCTYASVKNWQGQAEYRELSQDWDDHTARFSANQLRKYAEQARKDYSFTHAQMWLKRFDDAIKAENEACAKLCERLDLEGVSLGGEPAPAYGNDCAKAIRQRLQGIQSEHCNCPGFCTGACEKGDV